MTEGNSLQPTVVRFSKYPASKGNLTIDSSDITISENSKTRIKAIFTHWNRTDSGPKPHAKLVKQNKATIGSVTTEIQADGPIEIGLDKDALDSLFRLVTAHRVSIEQEGNGDFLIVPLSPGSISISPEDKSSLIDVTAELVSEPELLSQLTSKPALKKHLRNLTAASKLQEIKDAHVELQELMASDAIESDLSAWCKQNAWAFGFVTFDDVHKISNQDSLDLVALDPTSPYADIIELKRAGAQVLGYDDSHKNYYFTSEVSKAFGQCHRYLDVFSQMAADGLLGHAQVRAYHPKATLVIGRSHDWNNEKQKALHGLNSRLHDVRVITYDHLLKHAEHLMKTFDQTLAKA